MSSDSAYTSTLPLEVAVAMRSPSAEARSCQMVAVSSPSMRPFWICKLWCERSGSTIHRGSSDPTSSDGAGERLVRGSEQGAHASEVTQPVAAWWRCLGAQGSSGSHTCTAPSLPADASSPIDGGDQASARTGEKWPRRWLTSSGKLQEAASAPPRGVAIPKAEPRIALGDEIALVLPPPPPPRSQSWTTPLARPAASTR
mmetsp:Transcript_8709/g.28920  ORF Transcript_8709/g.28920 Transcript_8709/m.28920 type:complete len:200 (+) Transcript_8709:498-1097(+)